MTEPGERPERPPDLPVDIAEALEAHATNPHDLREATIYAQELLNELHEPTLDFEPNAGEEILKISDKGEYTEIVKRHPDQSDAYLYHVRREPQPRGDDRLRWALIGRVDPAEI